MASLFPREIEKEEAQSREPDRLPHWTVREEDAPAQRPACSCGPALTSRMELSYQRGHRAASGDT